MNNCPRCLSPVTSPDRCPQCGADFSLLRKVESLESEVLQTRRLLNESFNRIDREISGVRQVCVAGLWNKADESRVETKVPATEAAPLAKAEVFATTAESTPPPLSRVKAPTLESVKSSTPIMESVASKRETVNSGWEDVPFLGNLTEAQFGQKWLLIIGVVIMVLGIGYFLKYSFDRNWISPVVRILMAYGVGGALLGVGDWFRRKHGNFGLCLTGGGIASLYFSTFAAFEIYHLLPAPLAFGLMIVVTALAGTLALTYDTKWLAVLGLVGGFITPLVIDTGSHDHIALFTYLSVLNAGLLAIAFHKQWRLLNYLGFFFTWTLFSAWVISGSISFSHVTDGHFWSGIFFLNLFYLTYAIAPFATLLRGQATEKLQGFGVSVPNSVIAFGFSYGMIQDYTHSSTWVSLAALAYAGIQLSLAQLLQQRQPGSRNAMLVSLGQALFFLAVTVPILASNEWITIFWALQACLVLWVAQRVRSYWLFVGAVILALLAMGRLIFVDYERSHLILDSLRFSNGYTEHLGARLFTAVMTLGTVWLSGWLLQREEEPFFSEQRTCGVVYYVVFGLLLFYLLNVEVGGFFHEYAPTAKFAAISVLWAIFSVALISLGFLKKLVALRYTAMVLFALTIGKVFLVDMANVATPFRIISFIVLGLMLIGASFLYYKFRDRLLEGEGK